jgi:hypothetical protein
MFNFVEVWGIGGQVQHPTARIRNHLLNAPTFAEGLRQDLQLFQDLRGSVLNLLFFRSTSAVMGEEITTPTSRWY